MSGRIPAHEAQSARLFAERVSIRLRHTVGLVHPGALVEQLEPTALGNHVWRIVAPGEAPWIIAVTRAAMAEQDLALIHFSLGSARWLDQIRRVPTHALVVRARGTACAYDPATDQPLLPR